jgi:hypothetical protein
VQKEIVLAVARARGLYAADLTPSGESWTGAKLLDNESHRGPGISWLITRKPVKRTQGLNPNRR